MLVDGVFSFRRVLPVPRVALVLPALLVWFCPGTACASLDHTYAESSLLAVRLNIKSNLEPGVPVGGISASTAADGTTTAGPGGAIVRLMTLGMRAIGANPGWEPVLFIVRVPEETYPQPIASTHYDEDGLILFVNVAPGRYRIHDLWYPLNLGAPRIAKANRTPPRNTIVIPWQDELKTESETEALAGAATSMGEYEVLIGSRTYQEVRSSERSPAEAEQGALRRIESNWRGSWSQQAALQLRDAY